LKVVTLIACAVMPAVVVNEVLVYVLYASDASSLTELWFVMLVGALPLLVAAFMIAALRGIGHPAAHGRSVRQLRFVAGIGLAPIVVGGLWSGVGATFLGIPASSPAASALYWYQFTFIAAIVADVAVFVMALLTPAATRSL
jgi:hypothetical protein